MLVERAVGRNLTRVSAGAEGLVFVKQLYGPRADAGRRYRNCLAWDDRQREAGLDISPPLLEHDDESLSLSYAYVHDAVSLQAFIDQSGESEDDEDRRVLVALLEDAARLLAAVHSLDLPEDAATAVRPEGPPDGERDPLGRFSSLTPDEYVAASGGELACWRLFHHDEELGRAVMGWLDGLRRYPDKVPVHGDVRPDQFLIGPDGMCITDWEEFTLGPAARDLAGLAGALVFDALFRTFSRVDAEGAGVLETHRALLARGGERLDALRPVLVSFLGAYEERSRAPVDRGRLSADVGWYLLERVLARSMVSQRLPAADKAIAGIARHILIHDDALASLLH